MSQAGVEWQKLILSVGTHQAERPFSPTEVAINLQELIRRGLTKSQIAERLHLNDSSMIGKFLALLKIDPSIQHLVDWGQKSKLLSMTAAAELSRLALGDQILVAGRHLEYVFTKGEIQEIVQIRLRSLLPIESCIERVLARRPTITVRHVLIGAINDTVLQSKLRELAQSERDQLLRGLLDKRIALREGTSVKLSPGRFTVAGDATLADELRALTPDFESAVNQLLVTHFSNE